MSPDPVERLKVDEDVLVVTITSKLHSRVGNIQKLDLPEEGDTVEKGDELATVFGTEDDLHLHAPLSGIIIEINDLFTDNVKAKKSDPKHEEWLIKIEPQDLDDLHQFED